MLWSLFKCEPLPRGCVKPKARSVWEAGPVKDMTQAPTGGGQVRLCTDGGITITPEISPLSVFKD